MRERIGWMLLALQALWFGHQQQGPSRYFCWAPLHEHVWYRIDAVLADSASANSRGEALHLNAAEVARRYDRRGTFHDRGRGEHWELNAAQHVLDSVRWHEQSLPREQRAHVTVTYRRNDRETRTWTYAP